MPLSKTRKFINYIVRIKTTRLLLAFMHNGYLVETGWLKNFNRREPVDVNDNPIPWTTYSFIHFINDYLKSNMDVFEYGAGNSTIYYAQRGRHIFSVEHNRNWFSKISSQLPANTTLYFNELNEEYERAIQKPNKKFDVIIVDGRKRNKCIYEAVYYINDNGIIVLDDSERHNYKEGIDFLLKEGFKKIEFWGISHRYFHNKATTIFYKHL